MPFRIQDKIINLLTKYFFKKLYYRKLCLIGHSHLLNFRQNYKNIKKINLEIFKKLKAKNSKVVAYDKFLTDDVKKEYKVLNKINIKNNYDVIIFLSKHADFQKEYFKLIKNNNDKILDPFNYYS